MEQEPRRLSRSPSNKVNLPPWSHRPSAYSTEQIWVQPPDILQNSIAKTGRPLAQAQSPLKLQGNCHNPATSCLHGMTKRTLASFKVRSFLVVSL